MKITLISPYSDISSPGVRSLAAFLKAHQHTVQTIFVPEIFAKEADVEFLQPYSATLLNEFSRCCSDSELIGISLMTNHYDRAIQITQKLKQEKNDAHIIWGGIHPTSCPEECLDFADSICLGEGEEALLDLANALANSQDWRKIENIWSKQDEQIIRNPIRSLLQDLDQLPFPDIDPETFLVWDSKAQKILPPDLKLLKNLHLKGPQAKEGQYNYMTMMTRGCPHKCTFCANSKLKPLYYGQRYLRRRSVSHFIAELEQAQKVYPFINRICFCDDSFFAGKNSEIEEFAQLYKEKIGHPFYCLGSPITITEKKMELLIKAGMTAIEMGIQTGSARTNEFYQRPISNDKVLEAAQLINKYKEKIPMPLYDVILDNPYETTEDVLDTARLLLEITPPYQLQIFSLTFYPGTEIYTRAKKDGLLPTREDELSKIYRKFYLEKEGTYLNLVISLINRYAHGARLSLPIWVLKIMTKKGVVKLFERPFFKGFYNFIYKISRKFKMALSRKIR